MADNPSIKIDQKIIDDTVKRAKDLESKRGTLDGLYKRYREIYFMDNIEQPKDRTIDKGDWQLTPSPSGRNAVIGIKRLMDTSDLFVKVIEGGEASKNSDKIETALKRMLDVSSEGKKARVESDAILSASLYGPVVLASESIADLLAVKEIPEYKKVHLEKLRKKSPFLIKAINAEEYYDEFDEGMQILSDWKYKLIGSKVKARFGKMDVSDTKEYEVRDIFTPEYHIITLDGADTVFAKPHGMGCIPFAVSYAGGTELFHQPQEQLNSFLYAKAKGNLDKRENMILTTIFTSMSRNGLLGPMNWIDPDNAPDEIKIVYENGMRWGKGKVTSVNDKIIDDVVFQVKNMLDDLDGESTIYKQTLGENINAGTFSSLAMLSSAGKLPLIDPQRALQQAFKGIFTQILYRIKTEGIENELIKPADIPDDIDLEVTLEPKLPQDNLRNSQMAMNLGDLVSDEWKHSNLLQIGDSNAMRKQVIKETMLKSMVAQFVQNPAMMQQAMALVMPQMNKTNGASTTPPTEEPMPMQGQENVESIEQTDPMIPQQERM